MDEGNNVLGLQLILSNSVYNETYENATKFGLAPIGKMEEDSKELVKLESPIVKIKAQYSETLHLVSGFKIFFEGEDDPLLLGNWKKIEDAVTGEDRNTWNFNQSAPLIGLTGYQSERGIE